MFRTDYSFKLIDLRNPSISVNGSVGDTPDGSNPLGGILGSLLGETAAQQKARIADATKGANDLTGMIRHKKKPEAPAIAANASNGATGRATQQSKRKLDGDGEDEGHGKRARTGEDASS